MKSVKKKKRKKTLKEKILLIVSIVLIVISILAIIFVRIWYSKPLEKQKGTTYDFKTNSNHIDDVFVSSDKQINFLIVGVDASESLSDVIMVVSVDVINKTAEVLQIARDSYVGETSTGKINSIYNFQQGEYEKLKPVERSIKVIYEQFQIPIDYYAVITLEAFRNTVDAIGGIPINLPDKLRIDNNNVLPAGQQTLNGKTAEMFVRNRHSYAEGDIGRVKAQRLFLASALKKVKGIGLTTIVHDVIPQIKDQLTSNMTVGEMANFANLLFDIDMKNVRIHIVPGEAKTINRQSVYCMHADDTADLLNEYFRPYSNDVPVDKLKIIREAHTGNWYENTEDNFDDLISGVKPGQKKDDSSSKSDGSSE